MARLSWRPAAILSAVQLAATLVAMGTHAEASEFSVADSIRLERLVETDGKGPRDYFSPDKSLFYVLTEHGELPSGQRIAELKIFSSADAVRMVRSHRDGDVLEPLGKLVFAADSKQSPIRQVHWDAPDVLRFLGESANGTRAFSWAPHRSAKPTALSVTLDRVFSFAANGKTLVTATEAAPGSRRAAAGVATAVVVDNELLRELNGVDDGEQEFDGRFEYYYSTPATSGVLKLLHRVPGRLPRAYLSLSVSPTGRFVSVVSVRDSKEAAARAALRRCADMFATYGARGTDSENGGWQLEVLIFDVAGRVPRVVWRGNATPEVRGPRAIWRADDRVILTRIARASGDQAEQCPPATAVYDLNLTANALTEIVPVPSLQEEAFFSSFAWDGAAQRLIINRRSTHAPKDEPTLLAEARNGVWTVQVDESPVECLKLQDLCISIRKREDMNTPPSLFVESSDDRHGVPIDVLRAKPPSMTRARAELLEWTDEASRQWRGGLIYPVDYRPGVRYPLVIQTHGFDPDEFLIDGPYGWTTAFAARALASHGIAVLQVPDRMDVLRSIDEARVQAQGYEAAARQLAARGLIDPARVGLIGFSRTVWHVGYAAAFSQFPFAAVTLADGADWGYVTYVLHRAGARRGFENMMGAPPYGEGLRKWLEHSPTFNLDKVRAPVRIEAIGDSSPQFQSEWWVGLRVLGKPVEMVFIPYGEHILSNPLERLASQQGNVDWFRFWLKDEEDPSLEKAEQYARWRALRAARH